MSAEVIDHAKVVVRDTLGTLLARIAEPENAAAAAAAGGIGGPGAATVAGSGVRTAPHVNLIDGERIWELVLKNRLGIRQTIVVDSASFDQFG